MRKTLKEGTISNKTTGKRIKIRTLWIFVISIMISFLNTIDGFAQTGMMAGGQVIWTMNDDGVLSIRPDNGVTGPALIEDSYNNYAKNDTWPWKEFSDQITEVRIWGEINCDYMTDMFSNLTNLKKAFFNSNDDNKTPLTLDQTRDMAYMFKDCTALEELDMSGLGKLKSITNMRALLTGCNSLKTLNMNDLDISNIPLRSKNEKIWWADEGDNVNKVLPSLETFYAQNSRIWMTSGTQGIHSNKGSSFDMMCHDKDGEEVCNRMWFTPDVGATKAPEKSGMKYKDGKILLNLREWLDLVQDRWTTTLDSMEQGAYDREGPDWDTNPNVAANIGGISDKGYTDVNGKSTDGHTNLNGTGFIAPGIYERTDEENTYWDKLPATYYRLVNLGVKSPIVKIGGEEIQSKTYKELKAVVADDRITINTIEYPRSLIAQSNTYQVDMDPIEIIYPEAVKDIYGNVKDIKLTINGVTFTDQDHIPLNCNTANYVEDECTADRKKETGASVLRKDDLWYRKLFVIAQDWLSFQNVIRTDRIGESDVRKMGSGAEVDFTIEVVDPDENTTILFYLNDLDLPREQVNTNNWYGWNADGSYNGIVYGEHSEGIKLLEGNDLNEKSITFAKHSGLEIRDIPDENDPTKLAGKWILATGTDRDRLSNWSSVFVRAHADGAHYIWTNGNGCTTYMLENSPEFPEIDPVLVLPEALKLLDGAAPEGDYFKAFNFKVEEAKNVVPKVAVPGLDPIPNTTVPMSPLNPDGNHTNRGDDIYFGYIRFDVPAEYPHKTAHVYKVTEKLGNDPAIIYDTETIYYAQVIISGPITEEELSRGTRADIYMGEQHCDKDGTNCGDIIWDRDIPVTVWAADMKDNNISTPVKGCGSPHEVLMDANGKLFYRHDGKFWTYDPDDPDADGDILIPVSAALSDIHHQVSCPGLFDSLNVYEDRNLVDYVYDEAGDKYYSPFCHELTEGIDVWPDHADKPVMEKLVTSVPKHEGKSGHGYVIHITEDDIPVEYYFDGNHYYSVIGTMLPVSERFNPGEDDAVVYIRDEILLEEATGRMFYYSDNQYFIYGEDPLGEYKADEMFELEEQTIDTSDIPVAGTFRNYTRNTLTIEKHTVGEKEGNFNFTVLFDNKNFPENGDLVYEFRDPDDESKTVRKADNWSPTNNLWEFSLEGGQELSIHNIPDGTKYKVTEIPSTDGFFFVSVDDRRESYSVSGKIDPDEPADHFFDNALTEVTVEKTVIGNAKSFKFTAALEISGLLPDETFFYGIKGERLKSGTADKNGEAEAELSFTLADQEQAVIIAPYGTNVTITEETDNDYTTHVHAKISGSEPIADHTIDLSGVIEDITVHFTNSQEKDTVSVSKEVQGTGASEDKYFKFDIHFEEAGAGTVMTLGMENADQAPEKSGTTIYPADEMEAANSRDDDPKTAGQQIICTGDHGEADFTLYLRHGQSVIISGVPFDTSYTITEENEDYEPKVKVHGDTFTDEENTPEPIDTSAGNTVTDLSLTGNAEVMFTNSLNSDSPVEPDEPDEPDTPTFFRLNFKLPETGFSALRPQILADKPLDLNYKPLGWVVQFPELSLQTELVLVPIANGKYEVSWLGDRVGLLDGSDLPGEGRTFIAGHNHLNTMEAGPFALLREMKINDRVFITSPSGKLSVYRVYANEKIAEDDSAGLEQIANSFANSLTFITCEDERLEGGYASRRIVAAKEVR